MTSPRRRLVVGITGATGVLYATRLLHTLRHATEVESHLVISTAGVQTIKQELHASRQDVYALADHVYNVRDVGAALASGAFTTCGMVIVPCSMRTLAAVAQGLSDNLITRAADVTLKERRRLVLMVREAPYNLAHLRNMQVVTEMGGIIFPPLPAFYFHPASIEEMVDQTLARVLALFNIEVPSRSWEGAAGASSE